ncbi:MAG: alpha/beta fold hydrolase [Planctomycetota bacterium]
MGVVREAEGLSAGQASLPGDCITVTSRDGLELVVGAFPAEGPGPVVVLVHGISSHLGWYRLLAQDLCGRGISVYAPDRRGCGLSPGPRGHMSSWKLVVDDLHRVAAEAARRHPGRPIHLLGISLGGVFCTGAVLERPKLYASLLASAPGFSSRFGIPLLRRLKVLKRSFTRPTRLYPLPFGVDALTDNPDWKPVLLSDPLRTRRVSARFLVEMFRMQQKTSRGFRSVWPPALIFLAEEDALIDNEAILRMFSSVNRTPLRIEIFAGATHILPASRPRVSFCDRLQRWFEGEYLETPEGRKIVRVPAARSAREDLTPPPEFDGPAP